MSVSSMRRGAKEANEESHRAAQARDLGQAVGSLAAFIAAINRIEDRLEAIEKAVEELRSAGANHD